MDELSLPSGRWVRAWRLCSAAVAVVKASPNSGASVSLWPTGPGLEKDQREALCRASSASLASRVFGAWLR
jgi:hypothetical protein